jgi:hypothetical protein
MNGHHSYELAKMRMAEEHRWAANERLASQAREAQRKAADDGHEAHEGFSFSLKRLITHLSWT